MYGLRATQSPWHVCYLQLHNLSCILPAVLAIQLADARSSADEQQGQVAAARQEVNAVLAGRERRCQELRAEVRASEQGLVLLNRIAVMMPKTVRRTGVDAPDTPAVRMHQPAVLALVLLYL